MGQVRGGQRKSAEVHFAYSEALFLKLGEVDDLLLSLCGALLEAFDTTGRIHYLLVSGIKRV